MFKILLAASLLLLPSVDLEGKAPKNLAEQALAPTVLLGMGCTGTMIYSQENIQEVNDKKIVGVDTLVLTAKHCVDGMDDDETTTVLVPTYQNNMVVSNASYVAKVFKEDHDSDLAILRLNDTKTVFTNLVTLAPSDVELFSGETVMHIGYPDNGTLSITRGNFGSRMTHSFMPDGISEYYQTSSAAYYGSSGGPLFHFDDEGNYEQIGVVCCGNVEAGFIVWYTPIDYIQDFVERTTKSLKKNDDQARGPDVTPATN
jgi:S1-C subfamily serine protease